MKTTATTFPVKRDARRVPKPLMEKRRRDRINNSLETLRLLLLENTRNEKLKNPKVEKAEILESVVHFLKTEQEVKVHQLRECQGEQGSPCKRQQNYREGMRSCLLRVSHFISTKSQELEETTNEFDGSSQTSVGFPIPHSHPASPDQFHRALTTPSTRDPAALSGQHLPQHQPSPRQPSHPHMMGPGQSRPTQRAGLHYDPDTSKLLSSKPTIDITDPVWRPWPQ